LSPNRSSTMRAGDKPPGKLPRAFRQPGKLWRPSDIEQAEKFGII